MQAYLDRDMAESSSSTLIIDGLDCRPMTIIPSCVNTVFPFLSLLSSSSQIYAVIVLPCNFPRWQQLAPQALDNSETWRDFGEAEESEIQQGMKDFIGICDWLNVVMSWLAS